MTHRCRSAERANDFVIKIANVNGTGSASANTLLMKAVFRMGVPVVGKNYFPSNIQGLPTWYEIRVTKRWLPGARCGASTCWWRMNAETYARDMQEVSSRRLFPATTPPGRSASAAQAR
jgi:2-oxoglutarate ferredoxin oxidoreductase subunit alpha